ncbi:MAG: EFR1 family ferrodoxin [Candidatus Lokiarchaeota archaeon]|nr:EFR1 family ferrodoxin [Candidatus Lokiarchaeota archaeon]
MVKIEASPPTIAFFSPSGTTRRVASWFIETLSAANLKPEQLDLTGRTAIEVRESAAALVPSRRFLVLGTPVYAGHPPKPVLDFLRGLAVQQDGSAAVVYATYGAVTCGSALKDVATLLGGKNVEVLAAAKLVSKHSLVLDPSRDLFPDRPATKEEGLVGELVERVKAWYSSPVSKKHPGEFRTPKLPPRSLLGRFVSRVVSTRFIPSPRHVASRCTGCGTCVDACSTRCLTLASGKVVARGEGCAKCYNCLRACPTHAWTSPFLAFFPRMYESSARKKVEETASAIFD